MLCTPFNKELNETLTYNKEDVVGLPMRQLLRDIRLYMISEANFFFNILLIDARLCLFFS